MPLIRNFGMDDPKFTKQLELLERRDQFIHELSTVILPAYPGFESVWSIANRVYDRHCSRPARSLNRCNFEQQARALSA